MRNLVFVLFALAYGFLSGIGFERYLYMKNEHSSTTKLQTDNVVCENKLGKLKTKFNEMIFKMNDKIDQTIRSNNDENTKGVVSKINKTLTAPLVKQFETERSSQKLPHSITLNNGNKNGDNIGNNNDNSNNNNDNDNSNGNKAINDNVEVALVKTIMHTYDELNERERILLENIINTNAESNFYRSSQAYIDQKPEKSTTIQ